jgi:hypothetical protein
MNTNKDKNLNELLDSFYPVDLAAEYARDIERGDGLLSKHPAPLPRPALLADIKTQMLLAHYRKRKAHRLHYVYSSVAIAASLTIVCGLAWFYIAGTVGTTSNQLAVNNPAFYNTATEEIASITAQLEQIEDSASAIKAVDLDSSLPAGLQADVSALETSIWKG